MNIDHHLIHTVHVSRVATTNAKGVATYGAAVPVRARVLARVGVIENSQGESVGTSHVLHLTAELRPNDRVWLPGTNIADPSAALTPVSITSYPSLGGDASIYEVALG